jgi:hypothetical protein
MADDWRRYPFPLPGADPRQFTFPRVDGLGPGSG